MTVHALLLVALVACACAAPVASAAEHPAAVEFALVEHVQGLASDLSPQGTADEEARTETLVAARLAPVAILVGRGEHRSHPVGRPPLPPPEA